MTDGNGPRLRHYAAVLVVVWTCAVGSSLLWNVHQIKQRVVDLAEAEARAEAYTDIASEARHDDVEGAFRELERRQSVE